MHVYSVMFTRIDSGAEEGAEKVADLKPSLIEELQGFHVCNSNLGRT